MEILNIKNLTFKYPQAEKNALDNIDLSVNEGDFILLCGASGSGKTTLLKLLKKEVSPFGSLSGEIIKNNNLSVSIVTQDTENQIVSDTVWHNLAFALENMNKSSHEIRQKVSEIAEFFDIAHIFRKKTSELSGGEKQILNLASVMVIDPSLLILDEPTSQLDPIATKRFLDMVKRLNAEMNLTVIISEHRTEELFNYATKVCVMDNGNIVVQGAGKHIADKITTEAVEKPFGTLLYEKLGKRGDCPVSLRECREYARNNFTNKTDTIEEKIGKFPLALCIKDVYFRYEKLGTDILRGLNLNGYKGEILSVLGGNGSGKTTLLSLISQINKPLSGKINTFKNKVAVLPQNVKHVFTKDILREDFALVSQDFYDICEELNIIHLLERNPYDLSGGEAQRAALCKILLTNPDILCLDEPTKGIDKKGKKDIQKILKSVASRGVSIIIVTHDADFAAEISNRCVFLFDGQVVSEGTPREVFSRNTFYTTMASRVSRGFFKNAVTLNDIISLCKRNDLNE